MLVRDVPDSSLSDIRLVNFAFVSIDSNLNRGLKDITTAGTDITYGGAAALWWEGSNIHSCDFTNLWRDTI